MAAGDSHRVATLLLPTADPREDLVKAVQEVISDVPEPKKCEITLMAAQKALDAGVPDRALALCDELAVVPYPRAARLAADLLARADAACTQEVRSRLVALCLLASSRSRPGRDGPAPAECLAQWRAVNPHGARPRDGRGADTLCARVLRDEPAHRLRGPRPRRHPSDSGAPRSLHGRPRQGGGRREL